MIRLVRGSRRVWFPGVANPDGTSAYSPVVLSSATSAWFPNTEFGLSRWWLFMCPESFAVSSTAPATIEIYDYLSSSRSDISSGRYAYHAPVDASSPAVFHIGRSRLLLMKASFSANWPAGALSFDPATLEFRNSGQWLVDGSSSASTWGLNGKPRWYMSLSEAGVI